MSSNNIILLSVRPEYADKIFEQRKTVELRRVRPKYLQKGDLVLIYVSSPIQALAGAFKVEQIVEKPLKKLWPMVKTKAGVTHQEFDAYYEGVSMGVGIFFKEIWQLPEPIALHTLKQQARLFQPPQSFRYARESELALPSVANLIAAVT